jgi:tRNA 2-thiouridine synthesizing protein E
LTADIQEQVMSIEVNGKELATDEEGYIQILADWSPDVAEVMAKDDECDLNENHWEVINFLRDYYDEYQVAPAVRVLTKAIGKKLGKEKGNTKYLYQLFPYGPAKQACRRGPAEADRLRLSRRPQRPACVILDVDADRHLCGIAVCGHRHPDRGTRLPH